MSFQMRLIAICRTYSNGLHTYYKMTNTIENIRIAELLYNKHSLNAFTDRSPLANMKNKQYHCSIVVL